MEVNSNTKKDSVRFFGYFDRFVPSIFLPGSTTTTTTTNKK